MTQTKKQIFFFCSFLALTGIIKAQQGTVAAGGNASGSGGSASYSIGQVDYITGTGAGGTITQGLQQPYEISVMTGIEKTGIGLSMSVYPNPSSELVTLSVKDLSATQMSYILSDARGRLIKQDKLSGTETIISMMELNKAAYIITVMDGTNTVKTFKIIKN
ncbi:MAG: hypothetical protein JWO09_1434 [Bacteroidetes bacterium]|nr:hypothetical protein [Bacteroidota bacterium]